MDYPKRNLYFHYWLGYTCDRRVARCGLFSFLLIKGKSIIDAFIMDLVS